MARLSYFQKIAGAGRGPALSPPRPVLRRWEAWQAPDLSAEAGPVSRRPSAVPDAPSAASSAGLPPPATSGVAPHTVTHAGETLTQPDAARARHEATAEKTSEVVAPPELTPAPRAMRHTSPRAEVVGGDAPTQPLNINAPDAANSGARERAADFSTRDASLAEEISRATRALESTSESSVADRVRSDVESRATDVRRPARSGEAGRTAEVKERGEADAGVVRQRVALHEPAKEPARETAAPRRAPEAAAPREEERRGRVSAPLAPQAPAHAPHTPARKTRAGQGPAEVHIGSIDVRVMPPQQPQTRPAPRASHVRPGALSRDFTSHFGLRQG